MSIETLPSIELSPAGSLPMYQELKNRLAGIIREQFQPGQRFFSYRDIAHASNVSKVTAQLAVKELIRDGVLKQQTPRITVVCNPAKSAQPIYAVGVVMSEWSSDQRYAFNDGVLLNAMLEASVEKHVHLQVISSSQIKTDPEVFDRRVREGNLSGLIWLSMRLSASLTASRWMGRELPQVAILGRPTSMVMPHVTEDNYQAAFDAMCLLLDEGHRRLLVIEAEDEIYTYHARRAGLRDALKLRHIELPEECFLNIPEAGIGGMMCQVVQKSIQRVRPTAVVQIGHSPRHTVDAATALELKIGKDLQIISFNRPYPEENLQQVALRFFEPRLRDIGTLALETWLECQKQHESDRTDWHTLLRTVPMDLRNNLDGK